MPQTQQSPTVTVRMPSGKMWDIPRENLVKAKSLGAIEVAAAVEKERGGVERYKESLRGAMGMAPEGGFKSDIEDLLSGSKFIAKNPIQSGKLLLESMSEGQQREIDKAYEEQHDSDWSKKMHGFIRGIYASIPGAGPLMAHAGEQIEKKDIAGAAGTMTPMLFSEVMKNPTAQELARKAAEAPGKAVKSGARSMLGAGEKVVEKAKTAAEEAAAKKTAEYTEKKAKYDEKVAEAKAEHEAKMAEKQAKHDADVLEDKAAHEAKLGAAEQSLSGRVSREAHARLKESRLNAATKKLTSARDQLVKETTKNLDAAETAERKSLDARYEDFRRKVLGVTPETPNGTLQANLSPIGEAVLDAKKNILKGSRTNITIFNDIMGRLKDLVEGPEGEPRPLEGQMIPTDQLRGYFKELGDKIFDSEVPGDVRRALDHVREASQNEIKSSIKDVHGQGALEVYDKLSEDWSGYKRVWYDRTSGSPLPRILKTMRAPVALHEGVNMEGQIADLLSRKHAGQSITTLLARKSQFGARPELVARLMAVSKKLAGLPDLYETIPVAKYPRFPGEFKPAERPIIEPFKEKGEPPEKPQIEPFNAEKFRKDVMSNDLHRLARWGNIGVMVYALREISQGKMPSPELLTYPIVQHLVTRALEGKPLDWLAKGGTP